MIQLGDPEHPPDVLEVLRPGGEDLQGDQVLGRDHRDPMTAGSDHAGLVQESLLEPWPSEDQVDIPARRPIGDRIDPRFIGKRRIRDPRHEPGTTKRCEQSAKPLFTGIDSDVDIIGDSRNSVDRDRLCSEYVPSKVLGLSDPCECGEGVDRGRRDAEAFGSP